MTTILSVRLDEDQARKLESRARKLGVNKSDVVRQLVAGLEEKSMTWNDVLKDVRAISEKIKPVDRISNPVLEERKKRMKRYAHLR